MGMRQRHADDLIAPSCTLQHWQQGGAQYSATMRQLRADFKAPKPGARNYRECLYRADKVFVRVCLRMHSCACETLRG